MFNLEIYYNAAKNHRKHSDTQLSIKLEYIIHLMENLMEHI